MRNLTCQAVEPPECLVEATPRSASARIGRIEPGAIGSVAFRFSVRRPGDFELVAQVSAANAPVPERIPIEGELLP
jgi:hypothetical protein